MESAENTLGGEGLLERATQGLSERILQAGRNVLTCAAKLNQRFLDAVDLTAEAAPEEETRVVPVSNKYQSLSVVVPGGCPNKCKFCVSDMHQDDGVESVTGKRAQWEEMRQGLLDRLVWAKEKDTDTVVLTGVSSEPIINKRFLRFFHEMNQDLPSPFRKIEIQSSGVGLDDETLQLLKEIGVKTFALSISSFDDDENAEISQTRAGMEMNILETCERVKAAGFNVRLCLNLNSAFDKYFEDGVEEIFDRCIKMGANQVTFRTLYKSGKDLPQDQWIDDNQFDPEIFGKIAQYIREEGTPRDRLPFGAIVYTVKGKVATIIDDDCMNSEGLDKWVQKYCILREDGKLYYDWADAGTLIF